MTPEEMFPFFAAYAICASAAIFFSLFVISIFLGLAIVDVWNIQKYPKPTKALLSVGLAFFPEIGAIGWSVYFGRRRKIIFRSIAFITGGIYLLLQIGIFYASSLERGLGGGLGSALVLHFMWLPFTLIGGVISFLVFRAILTKQNTPTIELDTRQR